MTKLLDQALDAARTLPPEAQDDIARVVLRLAGEDDRSSPVALTPDERAAVATSRSAASRGEFATDAQVRAVWAKHGYTLPALADLNSILDSVAAHSPQGARRIQARIQAIIDLLVVHPRIGARTDDPVIRGLTTTPYPYLVFYEATEGEIIVHAIRHAARDPSGMPGAS
jgi:toxin ParE1/3/4